MATNVAISSIVAAMVSALQTLAPTTGQPVTTLKPFYFVKPFFGHASTLQLQLRGEVGRTPCAFVAWESKRVVGTTIGRRVDKIEHTFAVVICSDSMRSRDDRSLVLGLGESIEHILGARAFQLAVRPLRNAGLSLLFDDGTVTAHALRFTMRAHVDYTKDPGGDVITEARGTIHAPGLDYASQLIAARGSALLGYWPLESFIDPGFGNITYSDRGSSPHPLTSDFGGLTPTPLSSFVMASLTGAFFDNDLNAANHISGALGAIPASFSLGAWIKPFGFVSGVGERNAIAIGNQGFVPRFAVGFNGNGRATLFSGNGTAMVTSAAAYPVSEARYIIGRYNASGNVWDLWVDGVQVGSASSALATPASLLTIDTSFNNAAFQHVEFSTGLVTQSQMLATLAIGAGGGDFLHSVYP